MPAEILNKIGSLSVLIPVFNDWKSVQGLLTSISEVAVQFGQFNVVLVNDGSSEPWTRALDFEMPTGIDTIHIVHLRRNLGHQRAIAIGLSYVQAHLDADAVVVMDADGQDNPLYIMPLIAAAFSHNEQKIVFAERYKRSESWVFQCGYHSFRLLHKVLTGISVRVGNFSVIPRKHLAKIVCVSETWNHYSAAVFKAKLPYGMIRTTRDPRTVGDPKMNYVDLFVHGLSAISVFSETVSVRVLLFLMMLGCAGAGIVVTSLAYLFLTAADIHLWTTVILSAGGLALIQITGISASLVFYVLSSRSQYNFIPIRDYTVFLESIEKISSEKSSYSSAK